MVFDDYLRGNGIEVQQCPFFADDYIAHLNTGDRLNVTKLAGDYLRRLRALVTHHKFDVVWIEKEAIPYFPAAIESFLLRHARVLLDLDDAWHLRYATGSIVRRLLGNKMQRISMQAGGLVVANQGLETWSRSFGATPSLVPTGLDIAHYSVEPEPQGNFTLGWIGGPFTAPYLGQIAEPLRRLSKEGVKLIVVGETKPIHALAGVDVEQRPWSEATEAELLCRCHVGLNPLPDDEWCQFKSGYKLIQYMAAGRASVASPVGANNWVQVDGETGLFATTSEEWYDAIARLRADATLRQRLAAGGRQRAETVFSVESIGKKLVDLIKMVAAGPRN